MLYASLLLAATAVFGLVAAQNNTPSTPIGPCCNVDPNSISPNDKSSWCQAQRNTCPEICGGVGKLKQGGNDCSPQTLNFTCTCSDGTSPNMSDYQQSVPGLMCRTWFSACINASGTDLTAQESCKSVTCGNKTTNAAASSSAAQSSGGASQTANSPSQTAASPSSSAHTGAATALAIAREYGTPLLAAGMAAVFGLGL